MRQEEEDVQEGPVEGSHVDLQEVSRCGLLEGCGLCMWLVCLVMC